MIKRSLNQIVEMTGGELRGEAGGELVIEGVSTDTRRIEANRLFVPLRGERFDGHDYVEEAIAKGAAAALWQRTNGPAPEGVPVVLVDDTLAALQRLASAYRRQLSLKIAAVTGSNGKTTTKDLTAAVLATTYKVHKTSGNYNNHIGLPLTILQLSEDTQAAVVEMGMSGRGEIKLLSDIAQPDIAIITNIGEAHLLQLGSREAISEAKLEILSGLKPGGLLVYNGDEPLLERRVADIKRNNERGWRFLTFGESERNDLHPVGIMFGETGMLFAVNTEDPATFTLPLFGKHNVVNALAALAVGNELGVSVPDLHSGLLRAELTGMRIELIKTKNGPAIMNDAYNASPTSMRAALELLEEMKGYGKKLVVLGDMLELGSEEREYHREIGRMLKPEAIDYVFTYGTLAEEIAREALPRFPEGRIRPYYSKPDLIAVLKRFAGPGDLVLVKGSRGMKLEEVVEALR